jgi:hypothetical protein
MTRIYLVEEERKIESVADHDNHEVENAAAERI